MAIPTCDLGFGDHAGQEDHDLVLQVVVGSSGLSFLQMAGTKALGPQVRLPRGDRHLLNCTAQKHRHDGMASFVISRRSERKGQS